MGKAAWLEMIPRLKLDLVTIFIQKIKEINKQRKIINRD